ncbi:MAG: hypothetical protein ACLS4Z_01085 [Christensenellaceae bacterium]
MKTPYAIIIMDGYGINKDTDGNAVYLDGSKNIAALEKAYPTAQLGASGMSVGLPDGQMGNSEVGHLNIGAGGSSIRISPRSLRTSATGLSSKTRSFSAP